MWANPIMTPLMVNGIQGRGLRQLLPKLERFGVFPVQSGTMGGGPVAQPALVPGSSLGVQLVRGDANLTAIGTVTARLGNYLLAFGHPFLSRGKAGYFGTTAYVHGVVSGLSMPFKLASPINLVGSITQDRSYGLLGMVNKYPYVVTLRVGVRDEELNLKRDAAFKLVKDDLLIPDLVSACMLSSLDSLLARIGPGSSKVRFEISGRSLPEPVTRENMFYSPRDVAFDSLSEIGEAIDMLVQNEFSAVEIADIKVECEVTERRLTATIRDVKLERKEVRPGESLAVEVSLHPFRGKEFKEILTLTIPDDLPPGSALVAVRGGGVPSMWEGDLEQTAKALLEDRPRYRELRDLLVDFQGRDRNNELVCELIADWGGDYRSAKPAGGPEGEGGQPPEVDERAPEGVQSLGSRTRPTGSRTWGLRRPSGTEDEDKGIPKRAPSKGGEKRPGAASPDLEKPPIKVSKPSDYIIEGYKEVELTILEAKEEGLAPEKPAGKDDQGAKAGEEEGR